MTLIILAITAALGGECEGPPTTVQQVSTHVDDAMLGFATLDEEGFRASTADALEAVPCLNEALTSSDAAAMHRLLGFQHFVDGDEAGATAALEAAQRIAPDYRLSTKIAPEGGKLRSIYDDAGARPESLMVPIRLDWGFVALVDGVEAEERPANVPALVQIATDSGEIRWSDLVPAGARLPATVPDEPPGVVAPAVAEVPDPEPVIAPDPVEPEPFDDFGSPEPSDDFATPEPVDDFAAPEPADDFSAPGASDDFSAPPPITGPEPEPSSSRRDRRGADEEPIGVEPEPRSSRRDRGTEPIPLDLEPSTGPGKAPFTAIAVTSAVLAAGLAGTSVLARNSFDNDPTAAKFHITNGAYYGAIGTVGLAVPFTIAAIAVKKKDR